MRVRLLLAVLLLIPAGALGQVPQNVEATADNRQVDLAWAAPQIEEGDTLTCYRVYRDTTAIPDDSPGDVSELRVAEVEPFGEASPSYTDSGLTNGTTYFYRVTAEIGETGDGTVTCGGGNTGESSFSNQASATPFAPTTLRIMSPESPASQPVEAGTAVDVAVEGTNVPSDETVRLRYRTGGATSFSTLTMAQDGTEFTASIPGADVTARGVEYVVVTRNKGEEVVRTPSDGVNSIRVTAETLSFTQPGGTAQTAYRMVTYPGQLNDPQLSTLFDELTPYDPAEWRLFAIGSGELTTEGDYVERNDLDAEMSPGDALWLISRSGATLGPVQGTSLRTDQPLEIPLREGWNLVGNPFAFEVPVSQLRVTNSAGTLQDVFGYDGTFVPKSDGDVLDPYRGYLIRLSDGQSGTLVMDPTSSAGSSKRSTSRARRTDWTVRVSAQAGQARDRHNVFGAAPTARRAVEAQDGREPPPIGKYVSLAFQPPSGKDAALWRDLRPADGSLRRWTAEVRTRRSGRVQLRASGLASVPDDLAVWLIDPALDVHRNLRETPRYTVVTAGSESPRRLHFLVGPPEDVHAALEGAPDRVPRLRLRPVVPNPVRSYATLRYAVPEPTRVTLALYDLLGRRVATLVDGRRLEAGTHSTVWTVQSSAGALPSGTYLLRLRAGAETRTRRLVVAR